jgi:hypothetical protein
VGIAEKTSSTMIRTVSSGLEEALMLGLVWGDCDSSAQGDTVQGDVVHCGLSLADDAVVALSVDQLRARKNTRFASGDCLANEVEVASRCCCSVAALGLLRLAAGLPLAPWVSVFRLLRRCQLVESWAVALLLIDEISDSVDWLVYS